MTDETYMQMALDLAKQGMGWTSPNPMVGAVIVKDGQIIGRGYHARYGDLHAERAALAACTGDPTGATMYVTLEPCCHHGRQPPCTDAILESGIARVVVGSGDPNPLVAGQGLRLLRQAGVQATEHVLEEECRALNQVFFHFIQTRRPYVVLKYAMTLDGKMAAYTGASQWITGEEARRHVHTQRHRFRAIMVGVGTVLADDPQLTCRIEGGRSPLRIICDTHLRTPLSAQVVQTAKEVPTLLATCVTDPALIEPYEALGCQVLSLPDHQGHVDLHALMDALGQQNIDSVLLEGGAALHWSALQAGLVQKVQAYLAPMLLGGSQAKSPIGGQGFPSPNEAVTLTPPTLLPLGKDFLLESEVIF
ncbi:MAG: bifunctional diaminohydroxyphosphoribosylaminopyrimidine deaminase/5-amino-6-(5-phosphoribosylamino)uracil reductase RibD [Evtepia sp.]|uniref:bifunctional diaminohydroxyphosphoribosylaminopyrimidine deaminase/5-amino-6-(5-phosphoribosylamino)uracil reductase RibD n=1 Tax=Evtepia sp. TaxID=2773933 RepID=UPI002A748479|nr:bifunctional diaminohydroxyphosphoribosylaminopyrimidine deaminase/5-amino-6-(5-phosphoribosylamino)uracil reductase RibD [Evtepia sp.]MDY3014076.1 bifunctional diaminohydroxyphosphoribosylaminopyrimidine deaminase/5-amino-6-(5-phosphoribosylamino)uracil reductase RibD [Evtepia sp.]